MKRALLMLLLAAPLLIAQQPSSSGGIVSLTIDQIMRGPQFDGYQPRDLRWAPDGRSVYFRWKEHTEPLEAEFHTWVALRDGSGLRKLSDEEALDAPPVHASWTRDRKRAVFIHAGDVILWDVRHRNLTRTIEAESNPRFTRDERHVAYVRGNNLYVTSLDDGSTVQMTNIVGADEKQPLWDDKKGTASQEFVKGEELKLFDVVQRRAKKKETDDAEAKRQHPLKPLRLEKGQSVDDLQLTADGRFVVVALKSEPEKGRKTIVPNYVTESGYTETIPSRELVGDVTPVVRIGTVSTADGSVQWFRSGLAAPPPSTTGQSKDAEKSRNEGTEKTEKVERTEAAERDVEFGPVLFSEDGSKGVMALRAADNKDWWLFTFDPSSAKGRELAHVHDDAWVNWMGDNDAGWMPDNATVWFLSEASGWRHLWTVPFSGGAPRQVTKGNWEVDDVHVSDDRRSIDLTTSEESLYERHLYRMPVTGDSRVRLTFAAGRHDAVVSPDGSAIADIYSYTNVPPEVYVGPIAARPRHKAAVNSSNAASANTEADIDHGAVQVTHSPAPEFFTYPWLDAPIVTYRATDGVDVPARLYKPANWKSGGPAVVFVHGAGYLQNVHRWWSDYDHEYMFHHFLMEHGYLVLDADYRASAGHGRDWRTAIYRHMGGRDLADEVDAARWLSKEYGVDSERIGIYGGSYGGFMTLMAMFTAPSVFKSGAALRPVTDWSHYNHGYTSDILNTPQTDQEAYRISSPIYFAEGLRGSLLICHGMADTNVHFQDTVRLVQKLIELHAQHWELAVYPVENHGFVEPSSWSDEYKRIFNLFEKTLK